MINSKYVIRTIKSYLQLFNKIVHNANQSVININKHIQCSILYIYDKPMEYDR